MGRQGWKMEDGRWEMEKGPLFLLPTSIWAYLDSTTKRQPPKSEARNPKSEIRNHQVVAFSATTTRPDPSPGTKQQLATTTVPDASAGNPHYQAISRRHSDFGLRISFGFRISAFGFLASRASGTVKMRPSHLPCCLRLNRALNFPSRLWN